MSVDSRGELIPERRMGRDEEFEELLEKYNVDEIEEKPKTMYSALCNRWVSLAGVTRLNYSYFQTVFNCAALSSLSRLS